jgi:hypothetical protein
VGTSFSSSDGQAEPHGFRYEAIGTPRTTVLALAARAGEYPGWPGYRFRDGELLTPLATG